jgi:hypothetical protein
VRVSLVFVFALLVLGVSCGGSDENDAPARTEGLTDLNSVEDFARSFAGDAGHARLVLLLSPT